MFVPSYHDGSIDCDATSLRIRGYYFPWGTKSIAYASIKGVSKVKMTALMGKGRIWGTANLGYWANLDVARPKKQYALIIDVGKSVKPFITPDDPDAAEAAIREGAGLAAATGQPDTSPFL